MNIGLVIAAIMLVIGVLLFFIGLGNLEVLDGDKYRNYRSREETETGPFAKSYRAIHCMSNERRLDIISTSKWLMLIGAILIVLGVVVGGIDILYNEYY